MKSLLTVILFSIIIIVTSRTPCAHRKYNRDATVCVCNETYCDDLDPIKETAKGVITLFETSKSGDRLKETQLKFGDTDSDETNKTQTITIDRSKKFQKVIGFGGAFTDASGINIKSLSPKLQQSIIKDYFSAQGIEYNTCRITIGGSDFSTRPYSLADTVENDDELKHFNLTQDDLEYKIPIIKDAVKASPHKMKLFGSPWSGPAWIKDNHKLNAGGFIKGQPGGKYYKIYANYLLKWLEAYKANEVPIWGLTIQNEPGAGTHADYGFNSMGFTAEVQRDFIKLDLGPILEKAGYGRNATDLMIIDDQRNKIFDWAQVILNDKDAAQYVSGTAVHWYGDKPDNAINLDKTYELDPNRYILMTESSDHVSLGYWDTFEHYSSHIITYLNHYTGGWVDWNLVVNEEGGPNWARTYCGAPIIINATSQEYYKNPFFYGLGHFSKFLIPDSVKVQATEESLIDKFQTTAFVRPDNSTVVIALNLSDDTYELNINDLIEGKISHTVKPRSMQTYIYYN